MPALAALPVDCCTTSTRARQATGRTARQAHAASRFSTRSAKPSWGAHLHEQAAVWVFGFAQLQPRGLVHLNLHSQAPVGSTTRRQFWQQASPELRVRLAWRLAASTAPTCEAHYRAKAAHSSASVLQDFVSNRPYSGAGLTGICFPPPLAALTRRPLRAGRAAASVWPLVGMVLPKKTHLSCRHKAFAGEQPGCEAAECICSPAAAVTSSSAPCFAIAAPTD